MSLPNGNDDDDWRNRGTPFGKGDQKGLYKEPSKIRMPPSLDDNATAAETSVESNSVVSGLSSVAPCDGNNDGTAATTTPANAQTPNETSSLLIHRNNNNQHSMARTYCQREHYIRQLLRLGIACGATFALAIVAIVPASILASVMVFLVVLLAFNYKLYQLLLFEYQRLVQGRGIGDYLPSSIYEQLTQASVHEFMSDTRNSYVNENAYLMLYLIPGLTSDQINEYVGRLAPRHQEMLHRQGLGYVLGNGFMRLIMGDERLQQVQTNSTSDDQDLAAISRITESASSSLASGGSCGGGAVHHTIIPRPLELPPTIPEGASEDDASVTSELGHDEDPATQYLRHMGVEPENLNAPVTTIRTRRPSRSETSTSLSTARAVSPQTMTAWTNEVSPSRRNNTQQQQSPSASEIVAESEAEEQVLYDAIGTAVSTYMGVAANMVQTSARRSATLLSGTVFRASMGVTLLGVGVATYGFWTGVYNSQTFFLPVWQMLQGRIGTLMRPPRQLELPRSEIVVGTTMFSGATAGIMLLLQFAIVHEDGLANQAKNAKSEDHDPKKLNGSK